MLKYGSDKPDLRNPLIVHDVGSHFVGSGFGLFAGLVDKGMVVRAVPAPNTAEKSRKFFDEMNDWARGEGFAGLGYATRKARRMGRADRQEPRHRRHGQDRRRRWGSAPTTASSSPRARKPMPPSWPARRGPGSPSSST